MKLQLHFYSWMPNESFTLSNVCSFDASNVETRMQSSEDGDVEQCSSSVEIQTMVSQA